MATIRLMYGYPRSWSRPQGRGREGRGAGELAQLEPDRNQTELLEGRWTPPPLADESYVAVTDPKTPLGSVNK
jgi:hypothetical protein